MISPSLQSLYGFITVFAPLVYLDQQEKYYPSTISFFLNHTHQVCYPTSTSLSTIPHLPPHTNCSGDIWLITNQPLKSPSDVLPFFFGSRNLSSIPVIAVILPGIDEPFPKVALAQPYNHTITVVYFTFYPYNRGKEVLGTVYDNHVGDIEKVVINFVNATPVGIIASYHKWSVKKEWENVSKYNYTHPILFSARGSHGLWFTPGEHIYYHDPELIDYTSYGDGWKTWENVMYIFPSGWQDYEWLTEVYRWGNSHTSFPVNNCFFGYCRLSDGPVGFLGKEVVRDILKMLQKKGLLCGEEEGEDCWYAGIYTPK